MKHFLERKDPWGHGLSLWVLFGMCFSLPLIWWSVKRLELDNNVENWLPSSDPPAIALAWYRDHFPVDSRVLISWEGANLVDRRVETFANKLQGEVDVDGVRRSGLKQVANATTPYELISRIVRYDVEPLEAVKRLEGVLIGTGPLKIRLTESGRQNRNVTIAELQSAIEQEAGFEVTVLEPEASWVDALEAWEEAEYASLKPEPTEEQEEAITAFRNGITELWREHDLQLTWPGMLNNPQSVEQVKQIAKSLRGRVTDDAPEGESLIADAFTILGSPVAISASLSEAGLADRNGTFAAIRKIAVESGVPEPDLRMGGSPVAGSALNIAVKHALWDNDYPLFQLHKRSTILFSCIVSTLLAFVLLRSLRLALLVLLVSYYATFITLSLVPLTNGTFNMVLAVMPSLMLVLTLSAAIHVANYWRYSDHQKGHVRHAVIQAVKQATTPCLYASLTTAIGLISLTTSPLLPVRSFGLYSAVGCGISLIVVLFCLPTLLLFWPATPEQSDREQSSWAGFAAFITRHKNAVAFGCVAVFIASSWGLRYFRTETKVIRYFPKTARVVQDYEFLENQLAGIVPVDTVIRFDQGAQKELNFLQRLELVRRVQNRIQNHNEISGTISLATFMPVEKNPEEMTTFQRLRFNKRATEVERKVHDENSAADQFLALAQDTPIQLDDHLSNAGDELWRITAQVAVLTDLNYVKLTNDLEEIAKSELKFHAGTDHVVTGMVPLFLRTQQAVLQSLIRSFGLAFGIIAVVMMLLLKNPIAGLITMLPNLLPVGMVFGLVSWAGMRVDIGTMITASVALGIAVDGTLHLITWFRNGLLEGKTRDEALSEALGHCGPAMSQTSFAIGIGMFVLYFADLLLISRFGWLMASLIGAALIADLVFLPALLAGVLGRIIQKSLKPDMIHEQTPGEASQMELQPHLSPSPTTSQSNRYLRID